MDIKPTDILNAIQANVVGEFHEHLIIRKISTDTRALEKDDVFFALDGPRFSGHDFIEEALRKGAGHVVLSEPKRIPVIAEPTNFFVVPDTLKAYGDLACHYRKRFKIPVVAVTGSTGKTTVKELLAHLLGPHFRVLKNRGTENNLIGVPKTLFGLDPSYEVLVLELGTNTPGEIERLASLVLPQIGILTQIGYSHLEGLKTLDGVRKEKLGLRHRLERGGILILNGEDPMLKDIQSGVHRVLRAGFSRDGCEIVADRIRFQESGTSFYLDGKDFFQTLLLGRHNVLNSLLAIAAAKSLDIPVASLQKSFLSFKPVAGRMNLKNIDGIHFIDDSYNANPTSFEAALETLRNFKNARCKGVICGDMLELGSQTNGLHEALGTSLASLSPNFIIATGSHGRCVAEGALSGGFDSAKIYFAKDSFEAGMICRQMVSAGDVVLVKGSRGMQMEKVFECFITSSTP